MTSSLRKERGIRPPNGSTTLTLIFEIHTYLFGACHFELATRTKPQSHITPRADFTSHLDDMNMLSERAAFHLSLHSRRSFRLTYRNNTSRRSKSGVYAEVVCRKCGERIREDRQPHLDTSATPVCPSFPQYVHSLVDLGI